MVLSDMVRARVRAEPQLPALAPLCTRTPTMPGVCCAGELRRRPAMRHCRHAKPASTLRHGTHVETPCLRRRADVCLLQPTNYWKNAQQNGMPFSLNPAIIYRGAPRRSKRPPALAHSVYAACPPAGITANIMNNGFCVMSQFFLNGIVKKLMLGPPP